VLSRGEVPINVSLLTNENVRRMSQQDALAVPSLNETLSDVYTSILNTKEYKYFISILYLEFNLHPSSIFGQQNHLIYLFIFMYESL